MSECFCNDGKEIKIGSGPIYHSINNNIDREYLRLVDYVLSNGVLKPTRAKINGKHTAAASVFGAQARFNFAEGFPILTTKKVSFDSLAHELVWFLSGSSNIKYLLDNNVHIWDAWAKPDGELNYGTYGSMWRSFPFVDYNTAKENEFVITKKQNKNIRYKPYKLNADGTVDQIAQLIDDIEAVKRDSTVSCGRRLIVTAWHPYYTDKVGLPPCHVLFQFNVTGDELSLQLYQRSCDLFLGVPFNISSYCLLLFVVAHICNLRPYEFVHTYGDLHIYENHIDQMNEQLRRHGHSLPKLWINPDLKSVDDFKRSDVKLIDYKHDPVLKGEVAI